MSTSIFDDMNRNFVVKICVMLRSPEQFQAEESWIIVPGYYRIVAVISESDDQVRATVGADVQDGEIDWTDSTVKETSAETFCRSIEKPCPDLSKPGIWYRSGRGYFPDENYGVSSG